MTGFILWPSWRSLGGSSDIHCSLHRRQPAVLVTPAGFKRAEACFTRNGPIPQASISAALAGASNVAHYGALLASTTANAAARSSPVTASSAAAVAAAAAAGLPPNVVAIVSLLPSIGTFILCLAAAAFLLSSVPAVWALARAAHRAERLLAAVAVELPDTVASMRLAGLELTDCVQELGALGGELTRGVRATAALATAADAGVRGGVAVANSALHDHVVPAVAKAERDTRGAVESHLVATSKLSYTRPLVAQAATAATKAVRRVRTGIAVGRLASAAVQVGCSARYAFNTLLQQQQQSDEQLLRMNEQALREQLEALRDKQGSPQQQQGTRAPQQPQRDRPERKQ